MKIRKRDGTHSWVSFKYEWLHILCFYCGLLGHQVKFCAKAVLIDVKLEQYAYRRELRASQQWNNLNLGAGWLVPGPPSKEEVENLARWGKVDVTRVMEMVEAGAGVSWRVLVPWPALANEHLKLELSGIGEHPNSSGTPGIGVQEETYLCFLDGD